MPSQTGPASSPRGAMAPTPEDVLEEIRRVCREELELHREISLDDELVGDLELDSMGLIVVAVAVENRFRVKLSEADSEHIRRVRDLAELVCRRALEAAP